MNIKRNKAWVTGANGFIGSHLIPILKRTGVQVIKMEQVDITDRDSVLGIVPTDIVFHLAGKMFVPFAWENPGLVYDINVGGTLNILEYCRLKGVRKIVLASSYIYGPPQYLPVDEEHPIGTNNPYSRSKYFAEELVRGYSEDYGIQSTILRLFNIYGPGQSGNLLIPTILSQLKNPEIILENPHPRRDYLYITDAVDAFVKAGNLSDVRCIIFNIGFGESNNVDYIAKLLIKLSGSKASIKYKQIERKSEIMDVVADVKKAALVLGWKPNICLEDGLKLTIQHQQLRAEIG